MKFGKVLAYLLQGALPGWRDKFLRYKLLKQLLKSILPPHPGTPNPSGEDGEVAPLLLALKVCFVRILNDEVHKFNDFYIDMEEDFVIRLQELKARIEEVRAQRYESKFSKGMLEIVKALVRIHGEMVLLKNYSSLNFTGLVKILKKYDKRTGALLLLPFIQRALHQPFFATETLTRLVQECETNLMLLFPLEPEVIESSTQDQAGRPNDRNAAEASPSQEDTVDVHRSTLAAIRAIQGIRRASSTCNPLSLAQFFHGEDDDGASDLTAENPQPDSSTALQNEEVDQKGIH